MTAQGDRLIATMIRAEDRLDADFKKKLEAVFLLLDPFEIDATYPQFEAAYLELVDTTSEKFFGLQRSFLETYLRTEFGLSSPESSAMYSKLSREGRERMAASLSTVTRASIKAHTANGDNITKAYEAARTRTFGVGRRAAREASREHMGRVSVRTKGVKGYKRVVTGTETCGFCNMLASRGSVYQYDTVGFKAHSDCDCIGVPAISGPQPTKSQKTVAAPKGSKMFDKEKAKAAVEAYQKRLDAGEELPVPPKKVFV